MKTLMLKIKLLALTAALSAAMVLTGCKEDSVAPKIDNLDFSVMSSSGTADKPSAILEIDTAKLLIKDIKLNVAVSSQDSVNFKVGPYVLYLDIVSSVAVVAAGYIPAGNYDKVRFQVHKLGDNEPVPDPDFADASGRYSVVVKGRFNGIAFVYKSTKSAHQKLTFPNQLYVTETAKSNITLHVQPYLWFMKDGLFLDPAIEANRVDIDNNIAANINNNFKIFVDNDRNGVPD